MRKINLKFAAGLMTAVMMFSCVPGFAGKNVDVNAAEAGYVEKLNIDDYKNDKAPKPSDAEHKDWVFAGWYDDVDCKDFVTSEEKADATGEKYAKFVSADVLSAKCQILNSTTAESETTKMRLVASVDDLGYKQVGFDLVVGEKNLNVSITTVYKQIVANEDGVAFNFVPSDFSADSEYFATATLINIPQAAFSQGIFIQPYWITVDGTKVYGVKRFARVEDEWNNILNIPVRLYTDNEVAAGSIKVSYDKEKYTYEGTETGDNGDVFDEIYVADDNNGTVTCVGNTKKAENTKADGLLVNLRFKAKSETLTSETFKVSGESFANEDEKFVYTNADEKQFDVSDVKFNNIAK